MSVYLYSVKSVSYGTPTGTGTMPTPLTAIGDTTKGTVTIEEAAGSNNEFFVDQKPFPILSLSAEEGKLGATMQFPDCTFATIAALKGGHGSATGYTPSVGFTSITKALQIALDSGHNVNIFNAACFTRLTGGGGRDKMLNMELKVTPLLTADGLSAWEIKPI